MLDCSKGHQVTISVVSPLITAVDVETRAFEVVVIELPLTPVVDSSTMVVAALADVVSLVAPVLDDISLLEVLLGISVDSLP